MRETLLDDDGKTLTKDTLIICISKTTSLVGTIYIIPGIYYYSAEK